MAECGRRIRDAVGIRSHIIETQYKAVIDVSRADDVLIDFVGLQVPTRSTGDDPARSDFDRSGRQQSFASGEGSQVRLSGLDDRFHETGIDGTGSKLVDSSFETERGVVLWQDGGRRSSWR